MYHCCLKKSKCILTQTLHKMTRSEPAQIYNHYNVANTIQYHTAREKEQSCQHRSRQRMDRPKEIPDPSPFPIIKIILILLQNHKQQHRSHHCDHHNLANTGANKIIIIILILLYNNKSNININITIVIITILPNTGANKILILK